MNAMKYWTIQVRSAQDTSLVWYMVCYNQRPSGGARYRRQWGFRTLATEWVGFGAYRFKQLNDARRTARNSRACNEWSKDRHFREIVEHEDGESRVIWRSSNCPPLLALALEAE